MSEKFNFSFALRIVCLLLAVTVIFSVTGCSVRSFKPVERYYDTDFARKDKDMAEARLVNVGGIARLVIDGKQVEPVIYPINNLQTSDPTDSPSVRQTILAAENGVSLFRIEVGVDKNNPAATAQQLDVIIDNLLKLCDNPYLLLYFRSWEPDASVFGGTEYDMFVDRAGKTGPFASMSSEKYLEHAKALVSTLIDVVTSNPKFSNRVIGYFPSGNGCEWFLPCDGTYDCSGAAQDKFIEYVRNLYGTEAALRKAYGNDALTFDSVRIPDRVAGGRYQSPTVAATFLTQPSRRINRDYYDFVNDTLADFVLSLAEVVKTKTDNRSLVGFYYGYNFETWVSTPLSGTYRMERILTSPYIDFLAGPVSYTDRNSGGVGMSMSLLSSVTANGKLWIDESDYRSPISTAAGNENLGVGMEGGIADKAQLIQIVRRQFGKQMVYNSGTWFLDLIDKGWWDDEEFWREEQALSELAAVYASYKSADTPDVALVYDSRAISLLADPWNTSSYLYQRIRDNIARSGLSFGLYTTQDVAEGLVNDAKLYVMMTPWRMDAETVEKVGNVLHRKGKTAIWMFGYGETAEEDFTRLTGMTVKRVSGKAQSGNIRMDDDSDRVLVGTSGKLFPNMRVYEKYYVDDKNAVVLGHFYAGNHEAAVACTEKDGWKSVFCGGFNLTTDFLRGVAEWAGINIFSQTNDVIYADGSLVVFHSSENGDKTLDFPSVCDVYDYFADKWYIGVRSITFSADSGDTRYLFYGNRLDFVRCGIGAES